MDTEFHYRKSDLRVHMLIENFGHVKKQKKDFKSVLGRKQVGKTLGLILFNAFYPFNHAINS